MLLKGAPITDITRTVHEATIATQRGAISFNAYDGITISVSVAPSKAL